MRGLGPCALGAWRRSVLGVTSLVPLLMIGCGSASPMDRAGVELSLPRGWAKSPSPPVVPGSTVASWSGPHGASFVVLTSLPVPDPKADALATETAIRLANLPGVTVDVARTETWSGLPAARVEVVGPGTGDTLAPSGIGTPVAPPGKSLIPTRRVAVSFPRRGDTLSLLWHFPDSARPEIGPQVEATLRSLNLTDISRSSYSY